ncbi:MAG: hypothetical protein WKF58_14135 [Ilumatobacteraceae bacterium]
MAPSERRRTAAQHLTRCGRRAGHELHGQRDLDLVEDPLDLVGIERGEVVLVTPA